MCGMLSHVTRRVLSISGIQSPAPFNGRSVCFLRFCFLSTRRTGYVGHSGLSTELLGINHNGNHKILSSNPLIPCSWSTWNRIPVSRFHTSAIATAQNDSEEQTQGVPSKSEVIRLLSIARPEAGKLAGAVSLLAVSSSVTLAVPFCMGRLIDLVQMAAAEGGMEETLLKVAIGLSTIFVIGAIANAGRVYLLQISGQNIMKRLRERIFSSILAQEIAFFDSSRTGELVNRLAVDTELVSASVTQNVSDGLRSLAQVVAGIGMMFFMSPALAKVVLSVVPPVAVSAIIYGRFVRNITKDTQTALAESTQTAEEKISNIRTVRAFAHEDSESKTYSTMILKVLQFGKKEAIARSIFYGLMGLSGNAIMLLVLYNGGLMMQSSMITVGDLSAFLLYAGYVGISIGGLSSFYSNVNKSLGASTRLWELSDRAPLIPLADGIAPQISLQESDIVFKDIAFAYPSRSDYPIFKNLNLRVKAGSITAVVGASGSGKSTIGSLVLRFYEPDSGCIQIGGYDLRSINPSWLRTMIGTVSQEPVLFSGTIRSNIAYGARDPNGVTEDRLEKVARQSNIYDFVSRMPDGFDTLVGERGITLSGGQRQRVAIARALLKNPEILILDEATSALDAESEHLVQEALERLMVGRTTITIAHRLSTIKHAHTIAVLSSSATSSGSEVAELGTYEELMRLEDGLFRKLVERQTQKIS